MLQSLTARLQVVSVRELYQSLREHAADLQADHADLAKQLAASHDRHRTQQAAALRLLAAARACVAESRGAQERACQHQTQFADRVVAVRSTPSARAPTPPALLSALGCLVVLLAPHRSVLTVQER